MSDKGGKVPKGPQNGKKTPAGKEKGGSRTTEPLSDDTCGPIQNGWEADTAKGEKGVWTRRLLHVVWGGVIAWYIFPTEIFGFPTYIYFLILLVIAPLLVEAMRLHYGLLFMGMREHERHHVASYIWFMVGAIVLILLLPQQIAAPCIVTTAVVDPLMSATRGWRRRYTFGLGIMISACIFLLFGYNILLALAAGTVAVFAESVDLRLNMRLGANVFYSRSRHEMSELDRLFDTITRFDDDFTMQFIPALFLAVIFINWPGMFPEPMIEPLLDIEWMTYEVNKEIGWGPTGEEGVIVSMAKGLLARLTG